MPLKVKIIDRNSSTYLLISPNQYEKSNIVNIDSIIYTVTLKDDLIYFVSTSDRKFRTTDGVTVGDTFDAIKTELIISKIYNYSGWGKFIKLKSGWSAVFDYRQSLSSDSKILYFFKR